MADKQKNQLDSIAELVSDLLILELAKAGVQQKEIRKIASCDMRRVSQIAKVLKKTKSGAVE
jgi:hypothetical protein